MQILYGYEIDGDETIESLSDEELAARAKRRNSLRIKCPGLCSLYFEMALDIILKDVIGWDVDKNEAIEGGGLFGEVEALVGAIEEQGRATLHAHFQIWIKKFNKLREALWSQRREERREAKRQLSEKVDAVSCTVLYDSNRQSRNRQTCVEIFDHEGCSVLDPSCREAPEVVGNQSLRNLRHRIGQYATIVYMPSLFNARRSEVDERRNGRTLFDEWSEDSIIDGIP